MPDRATLLRLGKLAAADIAAGQPGMNSLTASLALEAHPDAVLDLIEMLFAEGRKKRPDSDLGSAYAYLIGRILESLRMAQENGHAPAGELVDAVRRLLLDRGTSGQAEPGLLLMVLMQFAEAKLDPGPELRQLVASLMDRTGAAGGPGESGENFGEFVEELAEAAEGDPFTLHADMMQMTAAFPENRRAAVGAALLRTSQPAAREAALGWLLDASGAVRNATASALEEAARHGAVSGTMLRRMIALRNWLPEADRPALDRAVQAARRKGVECAPWPRPQVREVLASGFDGAGAHNLFVVAREGRRSAIGSLLLKRGIGVRDAWARHGLTRSDLDEFLEQLAAGLESFRIGPDCVRIEAAHFLAVNSASGTLPPFGLLEVAELAGLQELQPEAMPLDRLLDLVAADADPSLAEPEAVAELLERSRDLTWVFGFLASWFEAGAEVEQLLAGKRMSRAKRVALVRDVLLPKRAEKWAELFAWTALVLRHAGDVEPWREFYLSARALRAGRPTAEIPLMAQVAEATVGAYLADRPSGRRLF